jgi:hypothetical protein
VAIGVRSEGAAEPPAPLDFRQARRFDPSSFDKSDEPRSSRAALCVDSIGRADAPRVSTSNSWSSSRTVTFPATSVTVKHVELEQVFEFFRSDDGDVTHFTVNGGFRADRQ